MVLTSELSFLGACRGPSTTEAWVAGWGQSGAGAVPTQARTWSPSRLSPQAWGPSPSQGQCPPLCREQPGYHLKHFTGGLLPQTSSGDVQRATEANCI